MSFYSPHLDSRLRLPGPFRFGGAPVLASLGVKPDHFVEEVLLLGRSILQEHEERRWPLRT